MMRIRAAEPSGWALDPGTQFLLDGNVKFRVWAPFAPKVELTLLGSSEECIPMEREEFG
jgi:1,4-alpha-glucan branching enzyme